MGFPILRGQDPQSNGFEEKNITKKLQSKLNNQLIKSIEFNQSHSQNT